MNEDTTSNLSTTSSSKVSSASNIIPKKGVKLTGNFGQTSLLTGERLSKSHRVFASVGNIEEFIAHIGIVKAKFFNIENSTAKQLFIYARLTKIQEDLLNIIKSITTTTKNNAKYKNSRFDENKIKDLEEATKALHSSQYTNLPGCNVIEAELFLLKCVCRKIERTIPNAKDVSLGIVVDDCINEYLNKLSSYFGCLITSLKNNL